MIAQFFRQKADKFFANRVKRSDDVAFGLRNVYVFFSRQGLLFGVLLLVTFITGINYGNNLVLGLCFYLFGVWILAVFYTFVQVSALRVRLTHLTLAEAGSLGWATLEISARSGKPSRQVVLTFHQTLAEGALSADDEAVFKNSHVAVLPSVHEPTLVRLPIVADKRGRMSVPRLNIHSVYPVGVMKAWAYAYFEMPMWIYPKPVPFVWQQNKKAVASDGEAWSNVGITGQSDFDALNEYVQGESLARVSWSHVARGAGMLTKHFADSVGREWCLDYADMPSAHHEGRLGELAFAVMQMKNTPAQFVLHLPSGQGELGQGDEFVNQCLLRLAKEA